MKFTGWAVLANFDNDNLQQNNFDHKGFNLVLKWNAGLE